MSEEVAGAPKKMRLRYAGRCRRCAANLPARTLAVYERGSKTVASAGLPVESKTAAPEPTPGQLEVLAGSAGASAQREYARRKNKRETRIRDAHPRLGGLILAMSDDPQSTKAWATGARGEEVLGKRLDGLTARGIHVLHDRRIPPTRANIDHIAVGPSGVFVIDAKKYVDARPSLRVEGGLFRPRTEKLMVGSRDRTNLVDGVLKQVDLVRSALEDVDLGGVPVHGVLCFVQADWPLIGGDFTIAGIGVLWPRKAAERLQKPGHIDGVTAQRIHRSLAATFPPA